MCIRDRAQPGPHVGVVSLGQCRVGGIGGAAGRLGLHDSLLTAGSYLALCLSLIHI